MNYKRLFLFLSVVVMLTSCSYFIENEEKKTEPPIAQVYDNYLYLSDIKEVVDGNISAKDSATKAENFIDAWIRDQLLVKRAEQNLTEEEKNVKWQLEDYRAKLLIYRYQQKYVEQKLDTTVTNQDIHEYYNSHAHNFILNNNVIKCLFIKIPNTAPQIYKTKWWLRSKRQVDSLLLAQYADQHATEYNMFDNQWIYFNDLMKKIPLEIENHEEYIRKNEFFEAKDSLYTYHVRVLDYRIKNENSPLYFVYNNVKTILLNEKKRNLIHKLEKNIYQDGIDQGHVNLRKQK